MIEIKTVNDVAEQTRSGSQNNLVINAVENYQRIKGMFEKGRPDVAAIQMPPNTPAILVGSGSSLDENVEALRNWKSVIFATPQTYPILMSRGVVPQFVTAIDTSIDDVTPLQGEGTAFTTLITHPSINPEMFDAWKGPIIFAQVNFDDETDILFRAMFPFITFNMGAQGCVTNMQLIMCAALQLNTIVLVGVDMCHANGFKRATGWRKVGNWRYEAMPNPRDPNMPAIEIPIVMQFYRLLLAVIWKGTAVNLFKVGKYGLDLIPEISMDDACAKNFKKPMEHHEVVKMVDAYTIPEGVYGSMKNGRIDMIEFADRITTKPKNDIEREHAKLWTKLPDGKWRRSI